MKMECKNCGTIIDSGYEDQTFCRKCGVSQLDENLPASMIRLGKKTVIAVMTAFAVLVAAIVLVTSIYNNPPLEVIPFGEYDEIKYAGNGNYYIKSGNDWGIKNIRGNEIIPFGAYEVLEKIAKNGVFTVRTNETFYFLDPFGDVFVSFDMYESVEYVGDNRYIVRSEAGMGVIDIYNNEFIEIGRYSRIRAATGDRYIVWDGEETGLLNRDGAELVRVGEYVIEEEENEALPGGGLIVTSDSGVGVTDSKGKYIIAPGLYDRIEALYIPDNGFGIGVGEGFLVTVGGRVGALDAKGKEIIPVGEYADILGVFGYFAIVENNEMQVSLINTKRI